MKKMKRLSFEQISTPVNNIKIETGIGWQNMFRAKGFLIVFLSASVILSAKLIISYYVFGTNDMTYWIFFSDVIQKFGTFKIYSLVQIYNHPPLMSWILKLIKLIEINTKLSFPFLFRLMPIWADYASVFVIWRLLEKYKIKNKIPICIICSVSPINFLVSGFHGNTDTVFIFLVLLAIYFAENNKVIFAGVSFGLSMCIKIAPIILAPIFIFYLRGKRKKITFILSFLIIPLIVFLPYLVYDYHSITRNIFLYNSLKGIWGIGHILSSVFNNENIGMEMRNLSYTLFKSHIAYGSLAFLIIIVVLVKFLMSNKKINLVEGAFLTFCLFLAITPGFGVQYLSWLSFFAAIVSPGLGTIYLLLGGLFLYRVYTYWGGDVPPYYANSDQVGQWISFEKILDIILWLTILVMLIKFLLEKALIEKRNLTPI